MEENFDNQEIKIPTSHDLQNLEIQVDNLGSGDIVHEIQAHMWMLRRAMKMSEKEGWPDWLLASWNEESLEVNKLITKLRMEQAKGKGFI
jgi:hypothetical protein